MQTKITIRNEAQTCYIDIEGTIGVPEEHQFEDASSRVATFESFRREVKRIAEVAAKSVVVNIRSTGGDVNDALLIYDALRQLDADIVTRCYGYTASAATIIAQAADEGGREISSSALYLIHNSTCSIDGNASSLDSRAELLRKTDEQLARLYALHSGREAEYFAALMAENGGEGRWLTAAEAIEAGLADRLIDFEEEGSESEPHEETEPSKEDADADQKEQEAPAEKDAKTEKVTPSDSATTHPKRRKHPAKEASAETAWGSIIRYLLGRLAVRIDEWIDSLREKRKEKQLAEKESPREDKTDKASQRGSRGRGKQEEECEKPEGAVNPAENRSEGVDVSPQQTKTEEAEHSASMPRDMAKPSPLQFIERQQCFAASRLKSVEDPSVRGSSLYSNEQAYSEDIKAFER